MGRGDARQAHACRRRPAGTVAPFALAPDGERLFTVETPDRRARRLVGYRLAATPGGGLAAAPTGLAHPFGPGGGWATFAAAWAEVYLARWSRWAAFEMERLRLPARAGDPAEPLPVPPGRAWRSSAPGSAAAS